MINRMGFNNGGIEVFLRNLQKVDRGRVALGANVGINKEGANPEVDYPALVKAVSPYADYVTVNISSPNTPGLRDLQGEARLAGILSAISTDRPVFVKIAPDLSEDGLEAVVAACMAKKVAGLIVSNTTIARPASLQGRHKGEAGGLSGAPLFAPSTAMLARAYRLAGRKLMLIGAGGISTPEDVLAKILAGASLVQVYTGFAYQGPAMIPRLKTGLAALLRARGLCERGGCDRSRGMSGFSALAGQYDGFIVDLWGVVHNGVTPYPGVLDCLARLRAAGKPVVFLSNAPRRAFGIAAALTEMGITPEYYAGIMSSGEAVYQALRDRTDEFAELGTRIFHLGPTRDRNVFDSLPLTEVGTPGRGGFSSEHGTG